VTVGRPFTPEITRYFGFGTALALSNTRTGEGTALALSVVFTLGTALALSSVFTFGTALALSAKAGEAAQTKAIVPKSNVLYDVIAAPMIAAKRVIVSALSCMLPCRFPLDSSHRYQHFMRL